MILETGYIKWKYKWKEYNNLQINYDIQVIWRLKFFVKNYNIIKWSILFQCVCSGAVYYAQLTQKKLQDTGYYEDNTPFKTSDEVCILFSCICFNSLSSRWEFEICKPSNSSLPSLFLHQLHVPKCLRFISATASNSSHLKAWVVSLYFFLEQMLASYPFCLFYFCYRFI